MNSPTDEQLNEIGTLMIEACHHLCVARDIDPATVGSICVLSVKERVSCSTDLDRNYAQRILDQLVHASVLQLAAQQFTVNLKN